MRKMGVQRTHLLLWVAGVEVATEGCRLSNSREGVEKQQWGEEAAASLVAWTSLAFCLVVVAYLNRRPFPFCER